MTQDDGIMTKKKTVIRSLLLHFFVVFISVLRWVIHNSVTVTVPHLFFMIAVGSIPFVLCFFFVWVIPASIWFENATRTYSKRQKTNPQPPKFRQIFLLFTWISGCLLWWRDPLQYFFNSLSIFPQGFFTLLNKWFDWANHWPQPLWILKKTIKGLKKQMCQPTRPV